MKTLANELQEAVSIIDDVIFVNSVRMLGLCHLNLNGCKNITDAGVQPLSGLVSLQVLKLGHCENITDAGVQSLSGLVSLQHLNLS